MGRRSRVRRANKREEIRGTPIEDVNILTEGHNIQIVTETEEVLGGVSYRQEIYFDGSEGPISSKVAEKDFAYKFKENGSEWVIQCELKDYQVIVKKIEKNRKGVSFTEARIEEQPTF